MAEDVKDDDKKPDDKICAITLCEAMGGMEVGKVIHLPESKAAALVTAGIGAWSKAEDMDSEEVDESEDEDKDKENQPEVVAQSVKALAATVEEKMTAAIAKSITAQKTEVKVPAQVNDGPIFKSNGAYIRAMIRADIFGDRTEKNKVMAHQAEVAKSLAKQGFAHSDLVQKSPLGMNETTAAQGGYLVNPQFSSDVYAIPHGQIDLQNLATPIDATSNVYNQRFINESSLSNGSIFGGLNVVGVAEGNSFTSSLPAWANVQFQLQKLGLFCYFTTEILQDAAYPVEAELDEYARKAFVYGINTQIVQGSTLEGLLNSPGLVTVPHSANDTAFHTTPATSLTYADIAAIWSAVYPDSQTSPKGVWLFHPSLAQSISQMTYTFSGGTPAWGLQYNAEAGLQGRGEDGSTPYKLMGKNAYPSWACSAPGVAGDIMYVDFATVRNYRKPFRVEISKEFTFGSDQVAVRFVSRLDCRTVFRNPVTGPNGNQQFSAVVCRTSSGT